MNGESHVVGSISENMRLFVIVTLGLAVAARSAPTELEGEDLVDFINANSDTWTAEFDPEFDMAGRVMPPMSNKPMDSIKLRSSMFAKRDYVAPASFDARLQWPKCVSISTIRDQSKCGSCWAVSTASVISDRECIFSNQTNNNFYSALDIISCCTGNEWANGCVGGSPMSALGFWLSDGVSTGSSYAQNSGCKPYPFPSCGSTVVGSTKDSGRITKCLNKLFPTPKCEKKCAASYDGTYSEDKSYGNMYYAVDQDEAAIQQEIQTNGPPVAAFDVYDDFRSYRNGVYKHLKGRYLGGHAVKIIGWGVEKGVKYWLCSNSWGPKWGQLGLFKILRGKNACGIEAAIVAAKPKRKC